MLCRRAADDFPAGRFALTVLLRQNPSAAPPRRRTDAAGIPLRSQMVEGPTPTSQQPAESISEGVALAHLAAIVAGSDDAIVSKTLRGIVTSWNAGAMRIFGYTSEEMVGQSITRIVPPELLDEEAEILAKLARGERIDHFDTVRMAKDGRRVHISVTVSPIRNSAGIIVGASKVARDIGERRRAEELQTLLFEELNHRVKNLLAMIQALATQSLRRSSSPTDFVGSFTGRIQALSRAHELLVRARMQGATVADLVREQAQIDDGTGSRVRAEGPAVMLAPQAAVQLGLVLHELATNARKHGSLSAARAPDGGGRVEVTWQVERGVLLLRWAESGGAPPTPSRAGFGTALIERALESQGGRTELVHAPTGTCCLIHLPLADAAVASCDSPADRGRPQQAPRGDAWEALAGKRVLIIEDEPLIAMELEFELAGAGCRVIGPVATAHEAARLIEEQPLDLALLDANLAGQPVGRLAKALAARDVPFAFATGYGRDALPSEFRDRPLLAKPFGRAQALAMLVSLLPG